MHDPEMTKPDLFVFRRKEVKYRVPSDRAEEFLRRLTPYLTPDEYFQSTNVSLYYDTDADDLVVHSMEKPPYKAKLRIRSYGTPTDDSRVFVELKKKYKGVVYKRREDLPYRQAVQFLAGGDMPRDTQILREIAYFRDFYHVRPRMMLAYDRTSYRGRADETLRMTFDRNIRYREEALDLTEGTAGHLLDMGGCELLEVKANGALPEDIVRIFNDLEIYPASFSKYANCYREIRSRQQERELELAREARTGTEDAAARITSVADVRGHGAPRQEGEEQKRLAAAFRAVKDAERAFWQAAHGWDQ